MAGERINSQTYINKQGEEFYLVRTGITKEKIQEHVAKTGAQISKDYKGKNLVLVGVLKGAFMFTADLARQIDMEEGTLEIDFVGVKSYDDGTESSKKPRITKDVDTDVEGKDVILVEDIIDTGYSLETLQEFFRLKGARSVEIAVMCTKPSRREKNIKVKYDGIKVDDFVVGDGLDYQERFRELKEIAAVRFVKA